MTNLPSTMPRPRKKAKSTTTHVHHQSPPVGDKPVQDEAAALDAVATSLDTNVLKIDTAAGLLDEVRRGMVSDAEIIRSTTEELVTKWAEATTTTCVILVGVRWLAKFVAGFEWWAFPTARG